MNSPTRRITVESCESVYQGTNAKGDPFTIYEIHGTDEQGQPIDKPLRSFAQLELGAGTFDVSPYTDKRGEVSYTLKVPRRAQRWRVGCRVR